MFLKDLSTAIRELADAGHDLAGAIRALAGASGAFSAAAREEPNTTTARATTPPEESTAPGRIHYAPEYDPQRDLEVQALAEYWKTRGSSQPPEEFAEIIRLELEEHSEPGQPSTTTAIPGTNYDPAS